MKDGIVELKKYGDKNGNVYSVEKAVRNGRWLVVRTNSGGHRKGDKHFAVAANPAVVQKLLDAVATREGWTEVAR